MGSNDDDDELLDMFMIGMLDKHTSPKSGGGCAGCILLMVCASVISKILVYSMI